MKTWLTVEQAHEYLRTGTGRGVRVAILDSGVDHTSVSQNRFVLSDDLAVISDGFELKIVEAEGRDVFGHGTAVCEIIHQLAPEAEIGSFRVLGEQLKSRTAIIREAARQALDRGYHILNCSFGCGREEHVLQYKEWIDEAYVLGRHVVAACNNYDFTRREWPGHFPSVITVNFAAADNPHDLFYRPGHLVEFAARGQDIEVTWSSGARKRVTGSSFAAPHVAGLLAKLLSQSPGLPPLQAKALLHQIAAPWPASNETRIARP